MRLITTILIVFATFTTFAQTGTDYFFLDNDTTVVFYHDNSTISTIEHLYMQNDDTDTTAINWIVEWSIPEEWALGLCDEDLCMPLTGNNVDNGGPTFIPANGYVYDWHLQITHFNVPGSGWAKITIRSSTDFSYVDTMLVNFTITDTAIVSIEDRYPNAAIAYPNPTTNILNLDIDQNLNLDKIILTNTNGQTVKTKFINNNNSKVDLQTNNLPNGNYNLTVLRKNGTVYSSQIVNIQ